MPSVRISADQAHGTETTILGPVLGLRIALTPSTTKALRQAALSGKTGMPAAPLSRRTG